MSVDDMLERLFGCSFLVAMIPKATGHNLVTTFIRIV